ncbi:WD40 repeat domain-containing protein [Streptomyces sp. NPDC004732]
MAVGQFPGCAVAGTFGSARTAGFHPKLPLLATAGAHDGTVRLWNLDELL